MTGLAFNHTAVQDLRKLLARRGHRWSTRRFVVEGPVLTKEAVAAGWRCDAQFVESQADAIDGAGTVHVLAPGVLERVAATQTPQPPLTVVQMPTISEAGATLAEASFVVVLDRVRDPGNLGTILRSCEAAGADLVVLTPDSVDPFNPKVVRSSAGAVFHVPIVEATAESVAAAGLQLVGTTSHDSAGRTVVEHTSADLSGRLAIVLGNEAAGLPEEWTDDRGPISSWVTIAHRGRSESLNVAMAATVLVFEAARQRSTPDR